MKRNTFGQPQSVYLFLLSGWTCLAELPNNDELCQDIFETLAMTVPAAGNWASSSAIPQTQNTAPVLEFQCLYTSDLRRKQKRWQDGRLKYHTFNKRIMVYDDRSNFVGDSHWHEGHAFGEGEEVELERCGILVEVSECVGTREQDLTPILNKALKDRQERAHVPAVASSPLRPPGPAMRMQTVGRLRAEPTERSAKRRKPNSSPSSKKGYAQNLTGATLALSGTPSTATPLRYDAGWLRTMKQPIEEIDMSSSAGVNRVLPERPVPIRTSQTKVGGSQAKRLSKRSSPTSVNSGHARKFTRTALVLASKTLTGRGLPPAVGIAKMPPNRLGQSDTAATTMEEEEFMDIDIYDKENQRVEQAMASSSLVTDPVKDHRKKPLPDLLSHQLYPEGGQPERPFNPLRIRARPKTKLLSTAKPPSRLPLFNERGNGIICPKISREMRSSMAPMSQARSVTETMPLNVKEHCLSSLLDSGLDHHGIDVLLTRKVSGQTSDAEELQGNLRSFTKDLSYTQSAEDSKDPVGSEGQEGALSSISPGPQLDLLQKTKQIRREWSMFRGNTETEIEKAPVSVHISFLTETFISIIDRHQC
jgi:hypothetical protein